MHGHAMNTPAARLRAAREHAGYRSAAQFAREIDMPEVTYRAYENGTRTIQLDAAHTFAHRLGVSWSWILAGENAPAFAAPRPGLSEPPIVAISRHGGKVNALEMTQAPVTVPASSEMPRDLPVLGTAAGSKSGAFQLDTVIIDYVRRPPGLIGAADVYAIYVVGDSMEPMIAAGELRFVHPHRPIHAGDVVVLQARNGEDEPISAYIKKLVRRSEDKVYLRQLNPDTILEFDAQCVVAIHKVLTMNDLFGV
jgi:SOS-response transcriptional repressor LexA